MKILILMPCDEQHVYLATGIYKELSDEYKDICFSIPTYMQYLMDTGLTNNWTAALCYSLISANKLYDASKKGNLIIIGNCSVLNKFDVVFNFQDEDEALEYKDYFIEKIKEISQNEQPILKLVKHIHTGEESLLHLKNIKATAHFIENYMKSNIELEKIEEEYKTILDYFKGDKNGINSLINGSDTKE